MKRISLLLVTLFSLFFSGCSLSPPKTYLCIPASKVQISEEKPDPNIYYIAMEGVMDTVLFLHDEKNTPRKFGRITMTQFFEVYNSKIAPNQASPPAIFCFIEPKTNKMVQFTSSMSAPEYDRDRNVLIWRLAPQAKGSIPVGTFDQNILVLTLDIGDKWNLFKNVFSFE